MATDHVPSVFGLNRYLWEHLRTEGILDPANYGGLIPIVPIQEEPELMEAMDEQPGVQQFPYIVYSWYTNGYDQNWFQPSDQVIYIINAKDQTKLRQIILLIMNLFKRYDESAFKVNAFIDASTLNSQYKAYTYKTISVQAGTGGQPNEGNDEPIKAQVTIRVSYTNSNDDKRL